jgi:hypothetical protein
MALPIEELRLRALKVYKIPVAPETPKQDIVETIRRGKTGIDSAFSTTTFGPTVPPGWTKILFFKETHDNAANVPIYFNQTGYKITVPRGLEVLIPNKVVDGALQGTVTESKVLNKEKTRLQGSDVYDTVKTQRFPYQILGRTEGPDPRPVGDAARAKRHQPREAFAERFGFWPNKEQLMEAMKDGAIRSQVL